MQGGKPEKAEPAGLIEPIVGLDKLTLVAQGAEAVRNSTLSGCNTCIHWLKSPAYVESV